MRPHRDLLVALALPLTALVAASGATAQTPNPHLGHVSESFPDTPGQAGLLATAIGEAQLVVEYATLGMSDLANIDGMQARAGEILQAIDASRRRSERPSGFRRPGLGYGLKRAAEDVASHIEMAAKVEGAPQGVVTHSVHIATSARNTVERADEIMGLALRMMRTRSVSELAPLMEQIHAKAAQLMPGTDADGDGRVGWQDGEGGLDTAQAHVELMYGTMK